MKSAPSKNATPAKSVSAAKVPRDLPVDENDPIDVAMRERKDAGSLESQISAADAKKKKLQIPQSLNLQIEKPKEALITFLTAEMIAAEETKAREAPKSASKAGSAAPADFETDPIDYTIAARTKAGGLQSNMTKADASKEKIKVVEVPSLVLANEKAVF